MLHSQLLLLYHSCQGAPWQKQSQHSSPVMSTQAPRGLSHINIDVALPYLHWAKNKEGQQKASLAPFFQWELIYPHIKISYRSHEEEIEGFLDLKLWTHRALLARKELRKVSPGMEDGYRQQSENQDFLEILSIITSYFWKAFTSLQNLLVCNAWWRILKVKHNCITAFFLL